ncbi:hypothetical protein A3C86_04180 [Candidatus Kaiserbacteria bacterium RIFCSPHIGHO2_02_FULL_49_16]|uniref:Uncharacterized protein n=1 Tax=Candidatus Kaiserbacteria bacterium RIFCSPHIGHO2_02_FULL_49_16 TaxID=1798490 RepID=A0A1F6DI18_9BACT|nr:MAG: hypothetical protein A3C86_04180 [Candidatus Kaiserbacteria bacterium RIFCSPHIGHO2_02_FULL_49_16]
MKNEDLFFLAFFLTILAVRLSVVIVPEVDILFNNIIIHHFWFGLIIAGISFLFTKHTLCTLLLLAVGTGLMMDELIFVLLGAGHDKEYWSIPSLLGVFIGVLAAFLLRRKIVAFLA